MQRGSTNVEEQMIVQAIEDDVSWDKLPKRLKLFLAFNEEYQKRYHNSLKTLLQKKDLSWLFVLLFGQPSRWFLLALPFRVETLGCTQRWAKIWYPYFLGSPGILYRTIPGITEGSTWGFTMLTTMCFQFSMLNIYRPYACHLKGRARMQWATCWLD
jgi:hypothetical protein